ncbi:MAG TPA: TetR/AcrR family transcriptional regulator [Hyphomonadaceae bacterium]|nr:TetR/AcrR family transcriptional regulator [Hyphomonadaceae bacterium]
MPKVLTDADIGAFRDRLCEVAEKQFAEHGPDGVTIRELADAMGVSPMTPYRYFKDKDAILAAVRARAFNRFAEAMEQAGQEAHKIMREEGPAGAHPSRAPGGAYIDFALANPAAYKMMFDVYQPSYVDYPELVFAMERARATMGYGLRAMASVGAFKGDVDLAAHAFWSAMHGAVMLEFAGLLRAPIDARSLLKPTLEALAEKFMSMKG